MCQGWIPEVFEKVSKEQLFAMAFVDVDHYQPALDTLSWAWPLIAPNGILAVHDYFPERPKILTTKAVIDFTAANNLELEQVQDTIAWIRKDT